MSNIRLHIPSVCHTITSNEFSNCAYTGKVMRFAPMMRSRGFEVYHYGTEGSTSGANKDIQIFSREEWMHYRILSVRFLKPELSEEQAKAMLADPKTFTTLLSNWDTPIWKEFNRRLEIELRKNYRSKSTDIFCMPVYKYSVIDSVPMVVVETGIGYDNPGTPFRIYESYAWMHRFMNPTPNNYWFVIPNYFDVSEWPLYLHPKPKTVGFLGRICDQKGCMEIVDVARRFPDVKFILCGQGDATPYLTLPNIEYKPPIYGKERAEYLGSLTAVITPSLFVEPFCGVAVEAQLCGTPVISKDYGAFTETVENFKTGLRGHTLSDYCYGIQMALDGKFDRTYIHERAHKLYDMYNLAKNYEYVLKSILDIHTEKNGWYSPDTHIKSIDQ